MDNKQEYSLDTLYIWMSWLQKSIRRWLLENSLYFCHSILNFSKWGRKVVFTRFLTYLMEDIWFANPYLSLYFANMLWWEGILNKDINDFSVKEIDEYLSTLDNKWFYKKIPLFVNNPKNREIDNALVLWRLKFNNEDEEFYSFFDKEEMFYNKTLFSRNIKNDNTDLYKIFWLSWKKDILIDWKIKKNTIETLYIQYNTLIKDKLLTYSKIKDEDLTNNDLKNNDLLKGILNLTFYFKELIGWKDWVLLYYTFFYLYGKHWVKYNLSKERVDEIMLKLSNMEKEFNYMDYDVCNWKNKEVKVEDYIFDKHTKEWFNKGRGILHFLKEGTVLENKFIVFNDKYTNNITQYLKNNNIF